jgi:hypothetical protein
MEQAAGPIEELVRTDSAHRQVLRTALEDLNASLSQLSNESRG